MVVAKFDSRVCALGEGPWYDERTARVWWVDIMGSRVLWRSFADPTDGGAFHVGAHVGAAVPTATGGMVLCLPDRLAHRDATGETSRLVDLPVRHGADGPALRSNDAKADGSGRLWHGTMAYHPTPGVGHLYRFDPVSGVSVPIVAATTIANGLGWSPDGSTMYFVDSPTNRIDAFDFDGATSTPTSRRTFAVVPDAPRPESGHPGPAVPDGLCVDADGGVWVAVWGGSAVHRYTPDGALDRTVVLPTPLVTSCAFAGPALDTLIITTSNENRGDDPAAGLTYAHRPGDVTGLPVDRVAI